MKLLTPDIYQNIMFYQENRPTIIHLKNTFKNKPLIGAEIGTARGHNAKSMFRTLNINHLYLIDPYIPYFDARNKLETSYADCFKRAQHVLSNYLDRVTFIKKTSIAAYPEVPGDLDFVYVDGNHSYEYVKKDIELYWNKVRSGGVLGGHDFSPDYYEVAKAVIEFAEKQGLVINARTSHCDWWFNKA
jgi:predicted O-methyltransferase YrrM